jgi:thioredoxin-dependent peroxiredoxin
MAGFSLPGPGNDWTGFAVIDPIHADAYGAQDAAVKASKGRQMSPQELGPGAKAPTFSLPRDGGGMIALADFAGRKLVLYFYPRADTPGCTKEAMDFSRLKAAFGKAGTEVLGVSTDPVPKQDKFKSKHKLAIALASDETHRMLEAYGVWQEKSMYGRKFIGVVRATFLIGPDQRIARIWPKVSVAGHAEEVLAAAKAL